MASLFNSVINIVYKDQIETTMNYKLTLDMQKPKFEKNCNQIQSNLF